MKTILKKIITVIFILVFICSFAACNKAAPDTTVDLSDEEGKTALITLADNLKNNGTLNNLAFELNTQEYEKIDESFKKQTNVNIIIQFSKNKENKYTFRSVNNIQYFDDNEQLNNDKSQMTDMYFIFESGKYSFYSNDNGLKIKERIDENSFLSAYLNDFDIDNLFDNATDIDFLKEDEILKDAENDDYTFQKTGEKYTLTYIDKNLLSEYTLTFSETEIYSYTTIIYDDIDNPSTKKIISCTFDYSGKVTPPDNLKSYKETTY